jgi:hypothetical protein
MLRTVESRVEWRVSAGAPGNSRPVEFRARHPRVSLLALLGLLVIVGSRVGGIVLQMWIRHNALSGVRASDMRTPLTINNFALVGLSAIGLALVIVAIFIDRRPRQ